MIANDNGQEVIPLLPEPHRRRNLYLALAAIAALAAGAAVLLGIRNYMAEEDIDAVTSFSVKASGQDLISQNWNNYAGRQLGLEFEFPYPSGSKLRESYNGKVFTIIVENLNSNGLVQEASQQPDLYRLELNLRPKASADSCPTGGQEVWHPIAFGDVSGYRTIMAKNGKDYRASLCAEHVGVRATATLDGGPKAALVLEKMVSGLKFFDEQGE